MIEIGLKYTSELTVTDAVTAITVGLVITLQIGVFGFLKGANSLNVVKERRIC